MHFETLQPQLKVTMWSMLFDVIGKCLTQTYQIGMLYRVKLGPLTVSGTAVRTAELCCKCRAEFTIAIILLYAM